MLDTIIFDFFKKLFLIFSKKVFVEKNYISIII